MELGGPGLIDFFLFFLFLRILYSAVSRGVACELFKLCGLAAGALLAFHYYPHVTERLLGKTPFLSKKNCDSFVFLSIVVGVTGVVSLVRKIVTLLFPPKELSALEKWVALFLGTARFTFLASVIVYSACTLGAPVTRSYSFRIFKDVAPAFYEAAAGVGVLLNDRFPINKEVRNCYEAKNAV
ncbi:MAG: CvpA family protein [Candidatus Omnitrophota bacterium]